MAYAKLNTGVLKLGDGKDGTVKQVEGYLVGMREKENKKSSIKLCFQGIKPPHTPFEVYSSTIPNKHLLDVNEEAIQKGIAGCAVRLTFDGQGKKKRGRNATKLVTVEVDSARKLPSTKQVPF